MEGAGVTERLRKALDAGGVVNLFPLLADWSNADLRALINDCEGHYTEAVAAIDAAKYKAIFTPEIFFSNRAADVVNKAAKDAVMEVLAVTSEICSVAYYYLEPSREDQG
jgi:hypothetical protein